MPFRSRAPSQDVRSHVGEVAGLREAYRDACEGELRLLVVDGSRATPSASIEPFVAEHRAGPVLRIDGRQTGALARLVRDGLALLSPLRRSRHPARRWVEREAGEPGLLDLQSEAERRLRLRDAAVDLFTELGRDNACVLVLEGAERPERALLDVVARLTERPTGPDRTHVLTIAVSDGPPCPTLASLLRGEHARRLTLEPLSREGVQAMLSRPDVVDAVFALTGGHPERLTQLLRHATSGAGDPNTAPVNPAIERLAVFARPIGEAEVARLLLARETAPTPSEKAALMQAGAVFRDGHWTLPVTERERVLMRSSASRLRQVHRELARALAEPSPNRAVVEATRHALAARDFELTLTVMDQAVDALSQDLAWLDAAELLRDFAIALEASGQTLPDRLHVRLIDCCWVAGAHEEAIRHAREHRARCPRRADVARRLGMLLSYAGRHTEAVALLEQARALSPVDLRLVATLAEAHYRSGELATAQRGCEAVLASEMTSPDARATRFAARQTLAKIAMAEGRADDAKARLLPLIAAEDEAGPVPPAVRCQALNNLAILAMGRGALGRAGSLLDQAVELAESHASVFHRGVALKNAAAAAQLDGRWDDALQAADRALQLLSGIADPSLRARLAFNTADLHRSLGDAYRAGRLCALARGERDGEARLSPGVHAEGLRVEAAISEELARWPEALERWEAASNGPDATLEAQLGRVRALHSLGRAAEAREVFAAIAAPDGSRDRARHLRCAALLGGVSEARLALEGAEATGDPLMMQEARLTLARNLADAGLHERSAEELRSLERTEHRLVSRVPTALRPLFEERRLVRDAIALSERLAQGATAAPRGNAAGAKPATRTRGGMGAGGRVTGGRVTGGRVTGGMVGTSPAMKQLRRVLGRVGPTEGTVLLTGESGSGKELAAEALHASSHRADGAFLRINCAALVDALLASELFGHERGAFTGANARKPGHFERADGGTLLLDEIGDISPRMQAALLRVLQEGTFERVGGTETQRVDVRVIAATHRDLAEEVRAGRFREDLYYRLSAITVRVPALRERRADIGPLARHLLSAMSSECGPKTLTPDAVAWLEAQAWPGNVRQLDNVLRRVAVLSPQALLTARDFEAMGTERDSSPPEAPREPTSASLAELAYERVRDGDGSIYELRKRLERELIERALKDADGNISRAAEWLGMKRPRLSKLVNEWGLK